ncbi:MAG: hypothetical protein AAFU83_04270, partial [Bacteroidota bacterium]
RSHEERQVLHAWINAYLTWFASKEVELLNEHYMREYVQLACLKPVSDESRSLLYQHFVSLGRKIEQNNLGEQCIIEALEHTLQQLDPSVFTRHTDELISVGKCLLRKIRPTDTEFSKVNYPKHGAILTTLHTTLLLIRELDTEGWSDSEGGLYQDFQEEVLAIKKVSRYYPVTYYSYLLSKSLEALRVSDARLGAKVWQGIKALARCYDVGRKLIKDGEVDVDAAEKAAGELMQTYRNVKAGMGWLTDELYGDREHITWYERLSKLSEAGLLALGSSCAWNTFINQIEEIKRDSSILQGEYPEDRKAFQYGTISQLTMLALHKEKRAESVSQLQSLAELSLWHTDHQGNINQDILEAIFEGLLTVAGQEYQEHREDFGAGGSYVVLRHLESFERQVQEFKKEEYEFKASREAGQNEKQDYIRSTELSNVSWMCCLDNSSRHSLKPSRPVEPEPTALVKAMKNWLGTETVKDLAKHTTTLQKTLWPNRLFQEVKIDRVAKLNERIKSEQLPTLSASDLQSRLKAQYQQPHFKIIPSFLGEAPMPVENIESYLKLNEQQRV